MDTSVASGAMPSIPMSLWLAAITPATWVPCSLLNLRASSAWFGTPLTAHETDRAVSTRPTRSGCVSSMPLSMMPTVTGARVTATSAAPRASMASAPQFERAEPTLLFGSGIVTVGTSGASAAGSPATGPSSADSAAGAAAGSAGVAPPTARSLSGTAATRVGPME